MELCPKARTNTARRRTRGIMLRLDENPEETLRPVNNCIVLKDQECFKGACPLWQKEMCNIEMIGKVLLLVFSQCTNLITAIQSMTREQKIDALKKLKDKLT